MWERNWADGGFSERFLVLDESKVKLCGWSGRTGGLSRRRDPGACLLGFTDLETALICLTHTHTHTPTLVGVILTHQRHQRCQRCQGEQQLSEPFIRLDRKEKTLETTFLASPGDFEETLKQLRR